MMVDMTGAVVVVSGPPGAGKSTVATELAGRCARGVLLRGDDMWSAIRSGFVEPWLPEAAHQNEVIIGAMAAACARFADGGYTVILDAVVGPWYLEQLLDGLRPAGVPVHFVVLRPDEETAVERATGREDHSFTDPEPVRQMYREFTRLGALESHVIDSSSLEAEQVAAAVREGVDAGHFRV